MRLDEALDLLCARLEAGLNKGAARAEPLVVLASPADPLPAEAGKGWLVLTLAAVRISPRNGPRVRDPAGSRPAASSAGALEADVLLTANFPGQYRRALAVLADVLDWLNANPVLTAAPGEEPTEPLSVAFVNLNYEQATHLLGLAGFGSMPYAIYSLRGIGVGS